MVNFPASLDALPTLSSSSKMNDPAIEGDTIVNNLHRIAEALEAKVGTGASTPTAGNVLRGTGAGTTAYGKVATGDVTANAITQSGAAVGSTSSPTTTSTSYVDMNEMSVALTTVGGDLIAILAATAYNSNVAQTVILGLSLDAAAEVGEQQITTPGASYPEPATCIARFTGVSAGSHTIKGRWKVGGNTGTLHQAMRTLLVIELKK